MEFVFSCHCPDTGTSTVIIKHLGKKFTGEAYTHPDEPLPSSYFGCELAEARATIKALKYERSLLKQKSDMALDFVKSCECYADFNKESPEAKLMYRQLNRRIAAVNKVADEINKIYFAIQTKLDQRKKYIEKINQRAKQDN